MTRHRGFDVRIAPEVEERIRELARRSGNSLDEARRIRAALLILGSTGTRANAAKKLRSLDLWEIRAGRHRLYFALVSGTDRLAVGAIIAKDTRRVRMAKLELIERKVHMWRDAVRPNR